MAVDVPSLSPAGWLKSPAEKLDKLLSYYFVSEFSQTNIYFGQVTSLPHHIKLYGHSEDALTTAMRDALSRMLSPYFDGVEVNITTDQPAQGDEARIHIKIDIVVSQGGVKYSAGRVAETVNGSLMRILDINNNQGSSQ